MATDFVRKFECCSSGQQRIDNISVSASGGAVQCSATELYTAYKVIVSRFFCLFLLNAPTKLNGLRHMYVR